MSSSNDPPEPQLVCYGQCPSGVAGGDFAPNVIGGKAISGTNGLWELEWDTPAIPSGKLLLTLTPLQTGPGGALTFGSTVVSSTEVDVQVRRSDTNAAFDGAFSFEIKLIPSIT